MNPESNKPEKRLPDASQRVLAIRDILLVAAPILIMGVAGNCVGLVTLAGGALVNLGYVLAIVVGTRVLRRTGEGWRSIGLARPPAAVWRTVLAGVGAFLGALVLFMLAQGAAVAALTAVGFAPPPIDLSRFNPLEGNLSLYLLMVGLAWTTIAFGEELLYRALVISRLIDHFGTGKGSAVVASATLFGLAHFAEGTVGMISNGAFGVLFGWIYLRSGRNLWITLIGHGLLNTFRFTLLYSGAI